MMYLGSTGISSGSWDSVAEVVALAMNSSPTQHLQNTCSGIIGVKPFRTRVRILATASQVGEKQDHLELVFGEKDEGFPELLVPNLSHQELLSIDNFIIRGSTYQT